MNTSLSGCSGAFFAVISPPPLREEGGDAPERSEDPGKDRISFPDPGFAVHEFRQHFPVSGYGAKVPFVSHSRGAHGAEHRRPKSCRLPGTPGSACKILTNAVLPNGKHGVCRVRSWCCRAGSYGRVFFLSGRAATTTPAMVTTMNRFCREESLSPRSMKAKKQVAMGTRLENSPTSPAVSCCRE